MKFKNQVISETVKFAIYGVLFGLFFPLIATGIDIYRYHLDFSIESAFYVQDKYPIHYIIDTAPFFLGLFAAFGGLLMGRLKEKNDQILKTSKFKQDFLANMSHEIRTPMVGVIGMIDLLNKNTNLDTVQKEYLQTIHQSSLNLLNILNQILDLSKLEAGKFRFINKPVDLRKVIRQNTDLFLANCTSKNIELRIELDENLPSIIEMDDNRLTQIISNLLSNAIKFTENGTILVKASLVSSSKSKDCIIKIEIIDSGIGISKRDQEMIFQRFGQIDNSSLQHEDGTGLGLTICQKLVKLMHGKMGVISQMNKGSNFWFTFQTKISDQTPTNQDYNFETRNTIKYNLNVLLVEDSETNILVSTQILKYLGCTTTVARNGREAIALFEEDIYHLILMDINLPELDGVQTTELLREYYKKIPPIIAITSNALPGDAERYTAKGLDDYITKPFTTETLNIKFKNWFGEHADNH